jgi:uncharacterized membrane protein YeaQ/YmgE (transglycosylase-associated protein family)
MARPAGQEDQQFWGLSAHVRSGRWKGVTHGDHRVDRVRPRAGFLAKFLMPGKAPGGIVATILLGIVGAVVGGFLGTLLGFGDLSGFDLRSMGLAVAGGVVVLFLYGLLARGRA